MTRSVLLAGCVVSLVLAVVATPPPPEGTTTLPAAISQSLGGMRVLLVDVLFLRAEQARAQGDSDEARALYRTLLQMHPNNAPAVAHLVDAEYDGLRYILDDDLRYLRWQELRTQLTSVQPQSARLYYAHAELILRALSEKDGVLAQRIERDLKNPRLAALMQLGEAALRAEQIERRGSNHLDKLAFLSLEVAADGLVRNDSAAVEKAVAIARIALEMHGEMLSLLLHRVPSKSPGPDPSEPALWVPLRTLMILGLDAIEQLRANPSSGAAEDAVETYAKAVGDEEVRSIPLLRKALRDR
jgi:tetratricopeptide (TPR) repeat protein